MTLLDSGPADADADSQIYSEALAVDDEAERIWSAMQEARVRAGAPQLKITREAFQSYYDDEKAYFDSFEAKREKRNLIIRLPDELLSAVFLAVPTTVGHAFALAGTCRWWRAVALSTTHLWARVSCALDLAAEGHWAEYLRTHLARAGHILLDVRLEHCCDELYLKPNSDLRAAVLAVWQRSERFKLVTSLEFDRYDDPFDFLRAHAPNLVDLRVEQSMQLDSDGRAALRIALHAPKLSKFAFRGAMLAFERISGSDVVEAEVWVNHLDGDAFPALFVAFPNLERLNLIMNCDLLANSAVDGAHLRELRLRLPSGTIDPAVAGTLRFPALESACFYIEESDMLEPDIISSFISNALGNVEILLIDLVPGAAEGIMACSRLKYLAFRSALFPIAEADEPVALVQALCSADRGSWLCPQLEGLSIRGKMSECVLAQKLVALAEARTPRVTQSGGPTVPLSRIEVEGFDVLQNRLNEILSQKNRDG